MKENIDQIQSPFSENLDAKVRKFKISFSSLKIPLMTIKSEREKLLIIEKKKKKI